LRSFFPQLKNSSLCYLDSAATALKPKSVIDAMSQFYAEEYATVNRALYGLSLKATERVHSVREKTAKLLNSSTQEIIFTRGTTDAINLVADSFCRGFMKRGEEVLITELEHHSNIVPWYLAKEKYGIEVKVIPVTASGDLDLDLLDRLLTSKTRLFSFAHISNAIGVVRPVKEIVSLCQRKGVHTFLDAAQSAPHKKLDVKELGIDFLAFSGHKMYGPTGIGVLFGKEDLLNRLPPYQGGGDMIEQVTFQKITYQKTPLRFEAGTPMIGEIIGLGAALEFLEKVDFKEERLFNLEKQLIDELLKIREVTLMGEGTKNSSIVSFGFKTLHPLDVGSFLDLKGISVRTGHLCAQPALKAFSVESLLRVSFGMYNREEDVVYFINHLKKVIDLLM
jgi:cysteine desulfurase/selenocysteine lyase